MKNTFGVVILLGSILFWGACNKQTIQPTPTDLGFEFQPLDKGHFIVYDVDSVIYNDFDKTIDTFSYEIKDEIGDAFTDDEGRTSHYVHRYQRKSSNDPWDILHVFYLTQDVYRLEWKENNLRFIKMIYPVKLNKKWKGNSYMPTQTNTELSWLDDWDYRYTDLLVPFNTGRRSYKNCHIIDQADYIEGDPQNANAFSARTYSQEVFAEDVGMVYREVTRWEYQPSTTQFRKGFTTFFRAKANN